MAALGRLRHVVSAEISTLVYHAFFSSFVSYGVESFGLSYSYRLDQISKLQKRAVRILSRVGPVTHSAPLFLSLDILPYNKLVEYSICVFFYKIILGRADGLIPIRFVSSSTRNSTDRLILLNKCRSNMGRFSLLNKGATFWNSLPGAIRRLNCSLTRFKLILKNHLLNR